MDKGQSTTEGGRKRKLTKGNLKGMGFKGWGA
ncbi:hypothetical protein THIAE_06215 [Thiomicrospira aerophila AL3]|uniref:Uncharacterized protein n=1 Tax=Thiomicrospira aerophila AL3 TaxID=717772 RepID=W0DUN9_9GAMM|nr:hypothetical protein THIAE_06215 [Thiomicrospira aerophila AL3]